MNRNVLFEACWDFPRVLAETSDVSDVLHELVECTARMSGVAGAGVSLLVGDALSFATALDETVVTIEQTQEMARRSPSIDAHRGGETVVVADLADFAERWPEVVAAAAEVGIHAAAAIPMHLDGETVGVLDLYDTDAHDWSDETLRVARWLADMATAYIFLIARLHSAEDFGTQLQHALDSRVPIEQAKGVLAERLQVDMKQSFATLRNHARNHNLRLTDVAKSVIDGTLVTSELDVQRHGTGDCSSLREDEQM